MRSVWQLTKRNIKIYFSSWTNFLFSMLSIIILASVYFLFLKDMNLNNFERYLRGSDGGLIATESAMNLLSDLLMLSCVISVGAVTVSLTALGVMVTDRDKKITTDFIVAPIRRFSLAVSYFISSFIICLIISTIFIILGGLMLLIEYGYFFGLLQIGYIYAATLLALVFGNFLMMFIISFLKRENALGGLGAIVGTLIGFISGAYVPVSFFAGSLKTAILCLPFAQMTAVLKQAFLYDVNSFVKLPQSAYDIFLENNGAKVIINGAALPLYVLVLLILAATAIFAFFTWLRFHRLKNK